MVMFQSYRDLEVWQKAMDLVLDCYQMTRRFPKNYWIKQLKLVECLTD
ncbi:MAG: four helix bundle protein [Deltaproteobacteria bacterium]|nr:four helix bundle protein [Deltaproteobacteria bacterium]MBW2239340.1 four helix bundle protein [Deltaproteobacteria bacterium]MBW2571591.1 four helix bundle protein [Deltaproteobacteria bacterium]MBW2668350.1 four helix bundle protein [Deltaproteobacteria bacterium]MBW2710486.1 four helix bundle protein [Deltaproteobacteria bacterium]